MGFLGAGYFLGRVVGRRHHRMDQGCRWRSCVHRKVVLSHRALVAQVVCELKLDRVIGFRKPGRRRKNQLASAFIGPDSEDFFLAAIFYRMNAAFDVQTTAGFLIVDNDCGRR